MSPKFDIANPVNYPSHKPRLNSENHGLGPTQHLHDVAGVTWCQETVPWESPSSNVPESLFLSFPKRGSSLSPIFFLPRIGYQRRLPSSLLSRDREGYWCSNSPSLSLWRTPWRLAILGCLPGRRSTAFVLSQVRYLFWSNSRVWRSNY